ncbi:MAG: hypothetical protein QOG09_1611 [Solirubrobacterales bacterium]|jgi:hypothetical protein|nr:hypothetical protein [Solirubrobacterales bacterium]MDX6652318.1 hypothetical protein [Solirubrobacterales bacterium]MDX6663509.1 hypothetical protein [Solirubrobacterales bacterium]
MNEPNRQIIREDTLISQWRHRMLTRGGAVVALTVVPFIVAALISVGGGGGLLPDGIDSLTSGPSEAATGVEIATARGSAAPTGDIVALTAPRSTGKTGAGTTPAGAGAPTSLGGTATVFSGGGSSTGPGGTPSGGGPPGTGGSGSGGGSGAPSPLTVVPGAPNIGGGAGGGGGGGNLGPPTDGVGDSLSNVSKQLSGLKTP